MLKILKILDVKDTEICSGQENSVEENYDDTNSDEKKLYYATIKNIYSDFYRSYFFVRNC